MRLAMLLPILLPGCSILASKEVTIGCQAADTFTTVYGVTHGAVEANPLMARIINSLGVAGFVVFKIGITYLLVSNREKIPEAARAGINVVTCGAATHNLTVIR